MVHEHRADAAAAKQYEEDQRAAAEAAVATTGKWEWQEDSKYYYNERFRREPWMEHFTCLSC